MMIQPSTSCLWIMADRSAEKILERRRVQNREAQRRFREKKTLEKTLAFLQFHDDPRRALDRLLPSSPSAVDLSLPLSSCSFPETVSTDIRSWDSAASDTVVADDASLFRYSSTPDDAASQLPAFPPQRFSTAALGTADNSGGIPMPETSVGTSTNCPSGIAETSLSPRDVGLESHDDSPLSPTSKPFSKSTGGWLSPLHIAARKGSSRIIRMLLQHNSDCNELDSEGLTPLVHAVMGGHEAATRLLLECGARIENARRDSERPFPSAIHWAVLKRREGVLRVLLDHSSDPKLIDAYDDLGRAPLHIAIDDEFDAGVGLLLQFGADPSRKAQRY
ncbi:ankyrin repeat-containing domain protein [Xylaria arbuscula]|nr:ankyrin repeat-containing domain protein [Xylaria arbuscula]